MWSGGRRDPGAAPGDTQTHQGKRLWSRGKEPRSPPGLPRAGGRLCRASKASSKGVCDLCVVTQHDGWWVPERQTLESFNVILLEKRVFAGIISLWILT